jgi:hypothetical protein
MDLGYSSSEAESDSDSEGKIDNGVKELKNGTPIREINNDDLIEVTNIFSLKRPLKDTDDNTEESKIKRKPTRQEGDVLRLVLEKDLQQEKQEDQTKEETTGEEEHRHDAISRSTSRSRSKSRSMLPADAAVTEVDMTEFYKDNQRAIKDGHLSSVKQQNLGKVTLHQSGGDVGRLSSVMQFNLNNEERIEYQNRERIEKEHALKRDKMKGL